MHIYNQGRCYQQNGKYEEAILRFREFQRKNLDTGNRIDSKAEENIAECKALLRDQSQVAKWIASVNSGYLYLSSDSGSTWAPRGPSMTWTSVAWSVDGTRLVAVGGSLGDTVGFVYASSGPVP